MATKIDNKGFVEVDRFWTFVNSDDGSRELVFDEIIDRSGGWEAQNLKSIFKAELESRDGDIHINLRSFGGNLDACIDLFGMLYDYSVSSGMLTITITDIVCGPAVILLMAADYTNAQPYAVLMLSEPVFVMSGTCDRLKEDLDKALLKRSIYINTISMFTDLTVAGLTDMMKNDTWLNIGEMKKHGFVTTNCREKDS